ncbi:gamma-1-syntrophin-like isoform X2 [Macrosteles quadrilineatus]|uniref:gamma-1-syntrophin-like isoform X2 n=1 Tax=Macrosteles quadrilineatus TaxID=74068 RepID=UPI0023E3221A|nr:gamma-1-syntrophin-like isoform X2 [Macrosteles quadrilineatus]XP_054268896.1 gamma-1-syntrophin-like isoform X2 [Macrosteles quadrilineatus]
MRINMRAMATPIMEEVDNNLKVRTGMVKVSDGKTRPTPMRLHLSMELLKLQKEEISPINRNHNHKPSPTDSRVRIVGVTRQKEGGLGLSIKGGAEHKLPILISRIFKGQAADQTGELFVGDAIIKVNGELITACQHDEAVNILRNAGDIVMLTVKHYRAATPFLQKPNEEERVLDNEEETAGEGEGGWRLSHHGSTSSIAQTQVRWVDIITVPLMMAYVTRYIFGTDKLRPNAFEVRGLNGSSTGVVHCDDAAILSQWLKYITDNIMGLTHLQMKLYNRNFPAAERIEYMGWVNEGILNNNQPWQSYRPRFLTLKGTDVLLFESPPLNIGDWLECKTVFKVYQSMLRVIKDSENVDERQHCFLIQTSGQESRYFSVETRQELLRIESAWHCSVCAAVMKLGSKTFNVTTANGGTSAGLTLDWNLGFALYDIQARTYSWQYKFSQLRGSSDDGKSRLKLHFQDSETKAIETKIWPPSTLGCSNLVEV